MNSFCFVALLEDGFQKGGPKLWGSCKIFGLGAAKSGRKWRSKKKRLSSLGCKP